MPDHTKKVTSTERDSWAGLLSMFEKRWAQLGLGDLWWIHRADFARDLKKLHKSTPCEVLFNATEQQLKKNQLSAYLENNFREQMEKRLGENWRTRLWHRNENNLESLGRRYQKRGLMHEYESNYDLLLRNKAEISERGADELFDNQEKGIRLLPLVRTTRRLFRKRQERHLRFYGNYHKLIRSLPDDDLDDRLRRLAEDFDYIGRSREWFREFEKMVNEVFDTTKNVDHGQNEPVVRILQNDFLLFMQGKYSVFWRYYELRDYCFRNNLPDLITRISYFENQLLNMHVNGTNTRDCETFLKKFVHLLETTLSTRARQADIRKHKRERILAIDHDHRLGEWAAFKQQYLNTSADVVSTFNHLRPILRQCTEWQHELRVFRSMIMIKRKTHKQRKNSEAEFKDAGLFIKRMATRIDREISADVAFRTLEQNLIRDDEFLDDLNLVRKNIALQKASRSLLSAEDVDQIKQDFVRTIWEKRASNQEGAPVTPLFSRSKTRTDNAEKDDNPALYKR